MQRYFSVMILGFGFILLLAFQPIAFAPNTGLVAHYDFNDCKAKDRTDGGSEGVLHGNLSCPCGVEGNGLYFNGQNDYVEFTGRVNKAFSTTDFTLSFYFKPTQRSIFKQSMLSKRAACDEINMLDIQLNQQLGLIDTDFHETEHKDFPYLSPEIEGTGWFHFALVRNGIRAYTYINGQLRQESFRCSGVDIANEALLSFGNSPCINTGRSRRFQGVLDELRVYEKALDHDAVIRLYQINQVEYAELNCVSHIETIDRMDLLKSDYICE